MTTRSNEWVRKIAMFFVAVALVGCESLPIDSAISIEPTTVVGQKTARVSNTKSRKKPVKVAAKPKVKEKASRLQHVLVFSKTSWYRHPSIASINQWFYELGSKNKFKVTLSEDARDITAEKLAKYQVVLLNNTTDIGKSLNDEQKQALIDWYQLGGGIVAIHGAGAHHDTWPWFARLMGCDFVSSSKRAEARVIVDPASKKHPTVKGLSESFTVTEEWQNFSHPVTDMSGVNVLLRVDETSYDAVSKMYKELRGEPMGSDHPVAWTHSYDGGMFFYTAIGNDVRVFNTEFGRQHMLQALRWAASGTEPGPVKTP